MKLPRRALIFLVVTLALIARADPVPTQVVWTFTSPAFAAPIVPTVCGAPRLDRDSTPPSISFNGRDDGYILPVNPIAGWRRFTIRMKIRPDFTGPEAQRFLHLEDAAGHRVTIELRLAPDGTWALDTFLKNLPHFLTLFNPALRHPSATWHTVELHYDGKIMSSWVDDKMELSGPVEFVPMGPGQSGVGVRLNRVSWYKGAIAQIEFASP